MNSIALGARHASPWIASRGTRVPVQSLIDFLEGGETIDEFINLYPPSCASGFSTCLIQLTTSFFECALMDECLDARVKLRLGGQTVATAGKQFAVCPEVYTASTNIKGRVSRWQPPGKPSFAASICAPALSSKPHSRRGQSPGREYDDFILESACARAEQIIADQTTFTLNRARHSPKLLTVLQCFTQAPAKAAARRAFRGRKPLNGFRNRSSS